MSQLKTNITDLQALLTATQACVAQHHQPFTGDCVLRTTATPTVSWRCVRLAMPTAAPRMLRLGAPKSRRKENGYKIFKRSKIIESCIPEDLTIASPFYMEVVNDGV